MFCCFCGCRMEASFIFCPKCGKRKTNANNEASTSNSSTSPRSETGNSGEVTGDEGQQTVANIKNSTIPSSIQHYPSYMKTKEGERRSYFEPKAKRKKAQKSAKNTEVLINTGLMEYDHGHLESENPRRVYGKTFPVKVSPNMNYDEVLERALAKWEAYDRSFSRDRGYVLVYPDGKHARTIPGSSDEFIMGKYKQELGKPYSRITLFLCPSSPKESTRDTLITDLLGGNEKDEEYIGGASEEEPLDLDDPEFGQTADFYDDATPDLNLREDDPFEGI